MRSLPAEDQTQRSGADGGVEEHQRGFAGEEDSPDGGESPGDLQARLGRGMSRDGTRSRVLPTGLDDSHRPARPSARRPTGRCHVWLG